MCRGNSHQGIPTTTVTASHVTQGRAQYESTIPQGTDEGLDLWEANISYPNSLSESISEALDVKKSLKLFIQ
jgi:hypothetical protein